MEQLISQLMAQSLGGGRGGTFWRIQQEISSGDDDREMNGLLQLCDQLNMATPLTLAGVNVEALVVPIIQCLRKVHNVELMLVAARALTYLADSLPHTLSILSADNNAQVLLQHLRDIQDVELSEQCITCLEKVCQNASGAAVILRNDGVSSMMSLVDFFTISSQRKILHAVERMCRTLDIGNYHLVAPQIPSIRQFTRHDDAKLRSTACACIHIIMMSVRKDSKMVAETFGDMADSLIPILSTSDTRDATFVISLSVILAGVSLSEEVTRRVIESKLLNSLMTLLNTTSATMSPRPQDPTSSPPSPSSPVSLPSVGNVSNNLGFEQTKELCGIFAALIVRNRTGPLAYLEDLLQMEIQGKFSPAAALSSSDEEEDNEEEEDEDMGEEDGDGNGTNDAENAAEDSIDALRDRIEQDGVKLRIKRSHFKCSTGFYMCDGCGKQIESENWYRCNDCNDADFCGYCLLQRWREHGDGEHAFTDMHALVLSARVKARAASPIDEAKKQMYAKDAALLQSALVAVPSIIRLCIESEAATVRVTGLNYLLGAVSMVEQETISGFGLCDESMCELIMAALMDTHLSLNIIATALVSKLLERAPPHFAFLMKREGVAQALLMLSKRYPESQPGMAIERRVLSLNRWQGVVVEEAKGQLAKLTSTAGIDGGEGTDIQLKQLIKLLEGDNLPAAAASLRSALLTQLTPFELSSNDTIHELCAAFQRSSNVKDVIEFVSKLAPCEGSQETSPLSRLVHHLHTIFSHLDQFQTPAFAGIQSIHSQIPMKLVPHPQRASTSRGKPHRCEENEEEEGDGSADGDDGDTGRNVAGPGRVVSVTIEPLATVSAISTFVSQHVLGQNQARFLRSIDTDESDKVEEVLPQLGEEGTARPSSPGRSAGASSTPSVWLRCNKKVLPLSMSVLQILQEISKSSGGDSAKSGPSTRVTKESPLVLYYSPSPFGQEYKMISTFSPLPKPSASGEKGSKAVHLPSERFEPLSVLHLREQLAFEFPHSKQFLSDAQRDILVVLSVLHVVVSNWTELMKFSDNTADVSSPPIKALDFVHHKLNNKARRHLSNMLLAGQQSSTWAVGLALDCNFLFSPSTRKFFFEISFCGTVRSLFRLQSTLTEYGLRDRTSADHNSSRRVQLPREKKRVWRNHPLECAMALLGDNRSSGAAVWEFEFYGEVGSGLGPTREFYTLVSQALRERTLGLWRSSDESKDEKYYSPLNGLYPRASAPDGPGSCTVEEQRMRIKYFKFIGRFLARAILDGHVASLALSPIFLALLRGDSCCVYDIHQISESLCGVLLALLHACEKKSNLVQLPGQKKAFPIESLDLTFSAPGEDDVPLVPKGEDLAVTSSNAVAYCDAVVNYLLHTGVEYAIHAVREGFHEYIPLTALRLLTVRELYDVLNGHAKAVSRKEFEENSLADHGFTVTCSHAQWLFDILGSFTVEEQKRFFLFLTGSPHLPVGGLASLRPKLTIVRKTSSEASVKESDQLPSAMTCQNYLKLPAYETREQMEEKLRQAMDEGAGAFLLT